MSISYRLGIFSWMLCFLYFSVILPYSGKTFFSPRQVSVDPILQHAQFDFIDHNNETCENFSVSANVFYKESTNCSGIARYFLPKDKSELSIKGLGVRGLNAPDMAAEWLNISSDDEDTPYPAENALYKFSSKIGIHPQYKEFGFNLRIYKELFERFYIFVFAPFVQAESNLGIDEHDKINERSASSENQVLNEIDNASHGLNNPMMEYGKMSSAWHKLSGIADLRSELGFMQEFARMRLDLYANIVIPTGHNPKCKYIFEPIVGGKHFGLGLGLNLDAELTKNLNLVNRFDLLYFFSAHELRSFDFISNGQWSRYMLGTNGMVSDHPIPMINLVTKNMSVDKDVSFNWLAMIHFSRKNIDFEVGYNFFFRDKEKLHLKSNWDEQVSIAYYSEDNINFGDSYLYTSKNFAEKTIGSDITDSGGDEINFDQGLISSDNLNIKSAECPSLITNKLYGSVQLRSMLGNKLVNLNFGASYEIASQNSGLSEWGVFCGAGLKI